MAGFLIGLVIGAMIGIPLGAFALAFISELCEHQIRMTAPGTTKSNARKNMYSQTIR